MNHSAPLKVDVLRPEALGESERALWSAWQAADPRLASPFLGVGYTLLAGAIAPGARVAVAHRGGEIQAFFPFQRRATLLQPLGAPLTDYQAPITRPGGAVDLGELVRGAGGRAYQFSGLLSAAPAGVRARERTRLAIEMPDGYDAWYAGRRQKWGKFFKDKERAARSLERDHGRSEVLLHDGGADVLDWILAQKRAQYRATGQHDVFGCGWTVELLRTLVQTRTCQTGGRIATMRVDGKLAAAEYSLRSGAHNHFWFPVYSAEHARYSCGTLLSLRTLELAAADGVTWGDFGLDTEGYKKYFTEPAGIVLEGTAVVGRSMSPWRVGESDGWRAKAARRMAVILACETDAIHAVAAAGRAAVSAALRRARAMSAPAAA